MGSPVLSGYNNKKEEATASPHKLPEMRSRGKYTQAHRQGLVCVCAWTLHNLQGEQKITGFGWCRIQFGAFLWNCRWVKLHLLMWGHLCLHTGCDTWRKSCCISLCPTRATKAMSEGSLFSFFVFELTQNISMPCVWSTVFFFAVLFLYLLLVMASFQLFKHTLFVLKTINSARVFWACPGPENVWGSSPRGHHFCH